MSKIIAFGYKKGVGKSTAAKFLATSLRLQGISTKQISFASKLKDVAYQLYHWGGLQRGVYYEAHYEHKEIVLPLIGKSPRDIWIALGNKMREIHPDTWINCALQSDKQDVIIITDLRFPNEAQAIKNLGGRLIRIDRSGLIQGNDPAEVSLDSWTTWDIIITNDGTLNDLNQIIETL